MGSRDAAKNAFTWAVLTCLPILPAAQEEAVPPEARMRDWLRQDCDADFERCFGDSGGAGLELAAVERVLAELGEPAAKSRARNMLTEITRGFAKLPNPSKFSYQAIRTSAKLEDEKTTSRCPSPFKSSA